MCGGVCWVYVILFVLDGSILLELFLYDGVGIMVLYIDLEYLCEVMLDDVGGIVLFIELFEVDGMLVLCECWLLECDIVNFLVIEYDGIIFGCVVLYLYLKDGMVEMVCLIVFLDS